MEVPEHEMPVKNLTVSFMQLRLPILSVKLMLHIRWQPIGTKLYQSVSSHEEKNENIQVNFMKK